MLKKLTNLQQIIECGLIVIVRTDNKDEAEKVAEACIEGGVAAIEITMTIPDALRVISTIARRYQGQIIVGAGTVLDAPTARAAILAGAEFIVSPMFSKSTIALCNRYQVVSMAGAMTVKEILEALEAGTDIIKVFPGEVLQPGFIKAVRGPVPQAGFMPTGGISPDNVGEWIQAGCVAVGVGTCITKPAQNGEHAIAVSRIREMIKKIAVARAL